MGYCFKNGDRVILTEDGYDSFGRGKYTRKGETGTYLNREKDWDGHDGHLIRLDRGSTWTHYGNLELIDKSKCWGCGAMEKDKNNKCAYCGNNI